MLMLVISRVLFALYDLHTAVSFGNCYYGITFDWKFRAVCAYHYHLSSEIIFH